ncbi:hypothetical protein CFC21_010106 [Triticum aestivum]|uniref:ENT domain-containing protein n=2 Tax=Triticum aestivum TaxID=4565 RepID=A0A3B5ZNV0_WHEAT|nr:uncharacterized protein LOC123163887 [Triticum aestivum]KAF6993180.1 hypothetical protein CFC21_010106 [Triticum aestivum]
MRGDRSAMRVTRGMHLEAKMGENAWRAGEVVWGNGHSYVLRWFDGGPDSERIRRTDVRPLPDPAVKLPADLATGDEVEVFHSNLWKRAVVVGAAGHGQFDVKIARSTEVLTADTSVLRPLMAYRGGEKGWVLIHKDNEIPAESAVPWRPVAVKNIKSKANDNGGGKFAAHSTNLGLGKTKRSNYAVDADIVRDVKRFQGNNVFLAKREPAARYHDNNIEVMDVHPSHYLKKREQETSNHTKPNDEEIDVIGGGTDSDNDDDSNSSKSDPSSSDGDSSSSGGSNSNSNAGARAVPPTAEHCQENQEVQSPPSCKEEEQDSEERTESRGSARMRHRPADEEEEQNEQEVEEHDHRVHGLELEAYVSVMKAFYFTGPLTWAKEELLSDLRLQLHVSSDEHLQAIWRLKGKK